MPQRRVRMEAVALLSWQIRVLLGLHIVVCARRGSTDKTAMHVRDVTGKRENSIALDCLFVEISSCATMVCPAYKICSEQPTGPVCTCPGNKVGTFCQYGKLNQRRSFSHTMCTSLQIILAISCRIVKMVAHVWRRIRIHRFVPAFVPNVTRVNIVRYLQATIPVSAILVKHVATVRWHNRIRRTHVSVIINSLVNIVNEVKITQGIGPIDVDYWLGLGNPCSSSPCLNQAVCQAAWNQTSTWFTCHCLPTYTGARCETSLLNPCGGLCMNG